MNRFARQIRTAGTLVLAGLAFSCRPVETTRLEGCTPGNFDSIRPGMSAEEVVAHLGEPFSRNFAGDWYRNIRVFEENWEPAENEQGTRLQVWRYSQQAKPGTRWRIWQVVYDPVIDEVVTKDCYLAPAAEIE